MNKILEITTSERVPKAWSDRGRQSDKNSLIRKIVQILNFISGNDLKNLLRDISRYDSKKNLKIFKRTRESIVLKKLTPLINNRIKPKNKHFFLKAFKTSKFSEKEVKRLGFKFSNFLWRSCSNSTDRKNGGRRQIPEYLKHMINDYLLRHSEISASRTTTLINYSQKLFKPNGVIEKRKSNRTFKNSRYLDNNLAELHKGFNEENELLLSKSTFMRHRNKIFKRARRNTDLCMCNLSKIFFKKNNVIF